MINDREGLSVLQAMWSGSRWLTVTGFVMLVDIVVSLVGLAVDPTLIGGAPAWMKPLKFGISTSLFCFTVAWMVSQMGRTQRLGANLGSILGGCLAVALTIEILLIDLQAARHTASHFNYATTFDATVFAVMGAGIVVVFLSTGLLLGASFMARFPDPGLGWTIRLGLLLAVLGMGVGPLMTMPTPEQLAAQHGKPGRMPHMGAHTVGAPDGGPGLPVVGWSADHGDLRIAHFIGLHGMQVLLLVWWLAGRSWAAGWGASWSGAGATRSVIAASLSVAGVFAVVLWQALRGLPLFRPDGAIGAGYAAWAVGTLLLGIWAAQAASQGHLLHVEGK